MKGILGRKLGMTQIFDPETGGVTAVTVIEAGPCPVTHVRNEAADGYAAVQLAYELKETKIKVNAAHPGWVKTDLGGEGAPMEIIDGAKTSVALAMIGEDGPTGAYIHMGETLPW